MTEHGMEKVYQAGMQLANALRLIGKHEEAHEIEVWVLDLTRGRD
jgi:hypothetical protein